MILGDRGAARPRWWWTRCSGQQDIVVEPFDAPRACPPFVGGATILADGAPALILDAAGAG